uniref:Domain of unknown function WSN domain-containing protein n=1 Tax=Caenorhabditis japonica TaxID=281687 RepID=A0A8R1I8H0_CAEJA
MKKVIIEALDVGEPYLIESINKTEVENVINTINQLDLLATQSRNTIADFKKLFDKLGFCNNTTVPDRQLFFFKTSNFHFEDVPRVAENMSINLDRLIKGIKSPHTKNYPELLENSVIAFKKYEFRLRELELTKNIEYLVNSWKSARLFILDIDFYQLITDQTYSMRLIKSLNDLQATFIGGLTNCEHIKFIVEQFEAINSLVNKTAHISEKRALVGFPQGAEDIKTLSKDFDNELLKKLLNHGRSLNDLRNLLIPVTNIRTQVEELENAWTESARKRYSHLVQKPLKHFKNICDNAPFILNSLTNVKTALVNLTPITDFNNTILNDFKNVLNSSIIFTNFYNEVESSWKLGQVPKENLRYL